MYLNQCAIWAIAKRDKYTNLPLKNIYGEYSYTNELIAVRREPHVVEIRENNGRTVYSKHIFYTKSDVSVDDKLDGEVVLQVKDAISLGGKVVMKKVITG